MQKLLSSLKQMTRGRERPLLEVALIEALLNLANASQVRLYKHEESAGKITVWVSAETSTSGSQVFDDGISLPEDINPIESQPLLKACLDTGQAQSDQDTTVLPIMLDGNRCYGFAALSGPPLEASQFGVVSELLDIFRNLIALLDYSEIDTLTGLLNRKTFDEYLWRILTHLFEGDEHRKTAADRPRRRKTHATEGGHWLGVIDIDHFKRVNDTFGHSIGDEVLLLIATMMKAAFRSQDKLFRFGGEEFVILLKPTKEKEAYGAFERFRKSVEAREFPIVGRVTVSVGFARIKPTDQPSAIFDRADQALYWVKKNGRNQSCHYETLVASGALTEKDTKSDVEFF
jgi:diguanylate cyclase (GGDEF)-like protein